MTVPKGSTLITPTCYLRSQFSYIHVGKSTLQTPYFATCRWPHLHGYGHVRIIRKVKVKVTL